VNRFAALIQMLPLVPVIGGATKFQPVFVGDVARAVVAALDSGDAGVTYTLGGPQILSMADMNSWIANAIGRARLFVPVPDPVAALMARATGFLPGAPMTWDQWLMLQSDNVVGDAPDGLNLLGVDATPLDAVASGWLVKYRKHGRFGMEKKI
jgi:uncharacterized protein YbjT (DUF2867 family)